MALQNIKLHREETLPSMTLHSQVSVKIFKHTCLTKQNCSTAELNPKLMYKEIIKIF